MKNIQLSAYIGAVIMWDKIIFSDWEIIYRKNNSFENIEAHEHIDYLHFIVNYMGYPVLIDSGLASYMSNHIHANARNAEYHNSLLIDDYAYMPMKNKIFPDKYYVMSNSSAKIETQTGYKIVLKTSGFNRIDKNINFERHLLVEDKSLTIVDNSNSKNDHKIENYFHFDSNLKFIKDSGSFKFSLNGISMKFINHDNELSNNDLNICSKQYGSTELKRVLNSKSIINDANPIIHRISII